MGGASVGETTGGADVGAIVGAGDGVIVGTGVSSGLHLANPEAFACIWRSPLSNRRTVFGLFGTNWVSKNTSVPAGAANVPR